MVASWLARVASFCGRRSVFVTCAAALLAAAGFWAVAGRLGVDTDTGHLFAASLPWKHIQRELRAAFPQNEDLLVVVVNAEIPEEADATANALADRLAADHGHFLSVRRPDASPYLTRNALLFIKTADLAALLDQTIDAQPFLGTLAADPSLRGLSDALSLLALGVRKGGADLTSFTPALQGFHRAFAAAMSPSPRPLSWQTLLAGKLASLAGPYRFVLVKPRLDYGSLQPGASASMVIREVARSLAFVRDGSARVRITGSVALDEDEFASVAQGAVGGLAGSLVLVGVWLFLALGSWRLVVPVLLVLLLGLDLTAAFAAVAVGTLNLVSVAFAILFVGLAVDFAIQFTVRFREAHAEEPDRSRALGLAAHRAGAQILLASLATAAGFLAFTPSDFLGVVQLGLIAGTGMLIAFGCTLTALPALLVLFRAPHEAGEIGFTGAAPADRFMARHRRPILAGSALLAAAGVLLLPRIPFDSDPLHTKNQSTESVRTLNDLAADPITNPYTIDVLTPSAAAAAALAVRVRTLPSVEDALTVDSLVPDDQGAKLPLIRDAASLLVPTLSVEAAAAAGPGALRRAVEHASTEIDSALAALPGDHPLVAIARDLRALKGAPDATLVAANRALTRFLPAQLALLRDALQAGPVTRADVPELLARDWVMPDGRAKLSVLPKAEAARTNAGLHRFVREVTALAPDAGGSAVTIVRSADTIIAAFRTAAVGAIVAITLILLVALRRIGDVARVMAPLLLASLLTVLASVLAPLPLNFANIIALPLLLGVGVSFNVYFVMNWRAGRGAPLASPTARAVLFSALTTATAFGSLALSHHPGTASMGDLLLLSLGCTLVVTLVFLPALLARR